jgi:hypothetical protein
MDETKFSIQVRTYVKDTGGFSRTPIAKEVRPKELALGHGDQKDQEGD